MKPLREVLPEQKMTRAAGFGSMSTSWLRLTVLFLGGDSKSKGTPPLPLVGRDLCATRSRQSSAFLSHFRERGTVRTDGEKLERWLCFLSTSRSYSPGKARAWCELLTALHAFSAPGRRPRWSVAIYFCHVEPD